MATVEAALAKGKSLADTIAERLEARVAEAAAEGGAEAISPGLLVAEGDSWFDYPFSDVLEELEIRYRYRVESVAHHGDTVEEMAYDPGQTSKLALRLRRLSEEHQEPRAILLSGGGNDIAGDEFAVLLNHRASEHPGLNERVVAGVLEDRVRFAILSLVGTVTQLCNLYFGKTIPILMHGYDYAIPDGRGYLGGFWLLPGPWLEPGFRRKGFAGDSDHLTRLQIVRDLIDRFNLVLAGIPTSVGHVRYVDLRRTLSSEPSDYKQWWANELHPTARGFRAVAEKFHTELGELP